MAISFYPIKVKKLVRETEDAVSLNFEIPDNLKKIFEYRSGQYLTIKVPIDDTDNRRAYSISSSPLMNEDIQVAVKKVDDGKVSVYINENVKEGDILEVMPPLGNFTIELDKNNKTTYIAVGGGSGITPLISHIKSILLTEHESKVRLILANKDIDNIIFKSELDNLETEFKGRLKIIHILSRPNKNESSDRLDVRRFSELLENELQCNVNESQFLFCGPSGITEMAEGYLSSNGVVKEQIHKESFSSSSEQDKKDSISYDIIDRKVKIVLYGEESEINVPADETIVSAAVNEGIDPPYSCQIGACATCRAKLLSGKVHMDESDALTDEEVEEGYVLTCQSHPLTDDVVVDYDQCF